MEKKEVEKILSKNKLVLDTAGFGESSRFNSGDQSLLLERRQ